MSTDAKGDIGQRVTALETHMERLVGNGQPGELQSIWTRLESQSRTLNRGIGAIIALQAVIAGSIALLAAGVIRIH